MLARENSGFSLDAEVRIAVHDGAGLERLLRACARRRDVRVVEYCCRS
jgi:hypothetical protein